MSKSRCHKMATKSITILFSMLLMIGPNVLSDSSIDNDLNEIISAHENLRAHEKPYVRERRYTNPLDGILSFFTTLANIKQIYNEQKNETQYSLARVYDLLADSFTDTATKKPYIPLPPTTTTEAPSSSAANANLTETTTPTTTTTTTDRYRISRKEFGYILGRNYRGLKKLFRIELNDALNQSQYSINEYKNEWGNSLIKYTVPKPLPSTTTTTEANN